MKIIQISDLHLKAPGERLYGEDPLAHLRECLADIERHHADANLLVLSGDLADEGTRPAYQALHDALEDCTLPWRAMMGNHDLRAPFLDVFPEHPAVDGFLQSAYRHADGLCLFLDTLDEGHVEGRLCERRLAWLAAQLANAGDLPVHVFCHHPPFAIGMPALDRCRLGEPDALHALCAGRVRHIFAGHVHRPVAGSWRGIPFSAVKGTHHQSALQFSEAFVTSMEAPGYAVIIAANDSVAVHFHDFPNATQRAR